jgi:CheY-like chemotaxis protein
MECGVRSVQILLVEDSPGDIQLTLEAFRDAKLRNELQVVTDGVDALAYLRQQGSFANAAPPDLILLDLHLPRKDGREVLVELTRDEQLRTIPVVALITSPQDEEVLRNEGLPIIGTMVKPVDLDQLLAVVRAVDCFGLRVVALTPEYA